LSLVSLAELYEVPSGGMILLAGTPGAGKSNFCHESVLSALAMERPVIFVTTEQGPARVKDLLQEKGMRELSPGMLNFVDAFSETAGASAPGREDTAGANCEDLTSISLAISKLRDSIPSESVFLAFDSLTSPYLFNQGDIFRFMKLCLARFASEGNSVLALMDEGCGKEEDLGAMMSLVDGIIRLEAADQSRVFMVVKHPTVEPTRIEVPRTKIMEKLYDMDFWEVDLSKRCLEAEQRGSSSEEQLQFHVNVFWPNFARWSVMLWDPERFPEMTYELWKAWGLLFKQIIPLFPRRTRLLFRLLMPGNLSRVKDMKKMARFLQRYEQRGWGIVEYLEEESSTDEHYFRVHESFECWGTGDVGATTASMLTPSTAGVCQALESWKGHEREWNAVETKCIGLGDPYCEWKVMPGEIEELKSTLKKEGSSVQTVNERLMGRLLEHLIDGRPLSEKRERLGDEFMMPSMLMHVPALVSERYCTAQRMGGAKAGKLVGEGLVNAGIGQGEAVSRITGFLERCKAGYITVDEKIRMKESRESNWVKFFTRGFLKEPSCYFTTGFLNGFFSAIKDQHVRETKCMAMGDPYCEWEFR
jgi:predicted hydrocarbon binding protein/KaiC/GvpD/RAD55 family RecA-like ATPase